MTLPTQILFIGDPHFKTKNVEIIPLFCSKILNIVDQHTFDFVVVAGDLLDNHEIINVDPYNLALEFVKNLSSRVKTFVLVGNHDYKNNQQFLTTNHWMNALKLWNNVIIVDTVVQFRDFKFVPYVPPGRFCEALHLSVDPEGLEGVRAVFAHQEFYGCKMGAIESIVGDKWDLSWPLVVSGHIHNKQWPQPNIYYPGSAMQHAFGQSVSNTVSIIIFHKDSYDVEEIDLKMPKMVIKYINVNELQQRVTKFQITDMKKYKLVLDGTIEEFRTFKKKSLYKDLITQGFKIVFKPSTENKPNIQLLEKKDITFTQILKDKITNENDQELIKIYNTFLSSGSI